MRFIEKIKMIERIDQLIRMKATGSARDLAKRINVSKSTVYEILEIMRNMGAEIEYCSHRRSYIYCIEKVFAIGFVDKSKISGGIDSRSRIFGQYDTIFGLSSA
jgi:DNA-binding IclR family transcriptional regulator